MRLLRERQAQISSAILALALSALACGRSSSSTSAAPADQEHSITVGNQTRTYLLHVPANYDAGKSLALVLSFHGGLGNAENEMLHTAMDPLADVRGFFVAYPNGSGRLGDALLTWNGGTCCGYAVSQNIDDVAFVRALVADIEASYKINPKQVFATGLSNGAIMSYRLACEASDMIAAIAPVSGTQNITPCNPRQPVSVIHFHGTSDEHVPYNGGIGDQSLAGVAFTSVPDSINFWVQRDQCAPTATVTSVADIQHSVYSGCADGSAVELYTIVSGKHAWPGSDGPAWPGGDEPTQSISATQLMWTFFAAHPKP